MSAPIGLLFSPCTLGPLRLRNRVVAAPMGLNMAESSGAVSPLMLEYHGRQARGGVALITCGATLVDSRHILPGRAILGAWKDEFLPGLARLAEVIHAGGALCSSQLVHVLRTTGRKPADLTPAEIREIVDDFVAAARRASAAGFDAVDLHMAHSYTLADFLSRRTNTRTDEYGGRGRAKIVLDIIAGVRSVMRPGMALTCRVSGEEFLEGGNQPAHTLQALKRLTAAGLDAVSVSAGGRVEADGSYGYSYYRAYPFAEQADMLNAYLAAYFKRHLDVPIMTAGKIPNARAAELILAAGMADLIALGRPLLADQEWVVKSLEGREDEIVRCIYCHFCREETHAKRVGYCTVAEARGKGLLQLATGRAPA